MTISTRFKQKASVIMLAPVFVVLTACGGGSDMPPDATAGEKFALGGPSGSGAVEQTGDSVAVRPANYSITPSSEADLPAPTGVSDANSSSVDTAAVQPSSSTDDAASAQSSSSTLETTMVQPDRTLASGVMAFEAGEATAAAGGRDPLKQPFSSRSIWNMPIGSAAVYVPANLSGNPGNNIWAAMPGIDGEKIILKPTAPLVSVNLSNAGWTGRNRCTATGGLMFKVPMPSTYVVPHSTRNSSATFLLPDRRTLLQTQPLARCTAGGSATSWAKFANVDLYGTGITGAHGGSGLSSIGGSIRLGELRPGTTTGPRHALKVNVYAKEALFKCTTRSACSRWPAVASDSYAVGWYGSANGNRNTAMKMGALLAIPPTKSIASLGLETAPAKQLAWTLQNYGAYIVDDTYAAGFDFNAEEGPDGSKADEFRRDWGFSMAQKVQGNTPWVRDIQRLAKALYVVNNNSATTIGGGGTPRQSLAPAIAP